MVFHQATTAAVLLFFAPVPVRSFITPSSIVIATTTTQHQQHQHQQKQQRQTLLFVASQDLEKLVRTTNDNHESDNNMNDDNINDIDDIDNENDDTMMIEIPSFIKTSMLRRVYPSLIRYKRKYGHVNIPLGTVDGYRCDTIRTLQIQQKLLPQEVEHLRDALDFRFRSLEDVYRRSTTANGDNFDAFLEKLLRYEDEHQNNYQVPKKYECDPELGAWVTGIRRIGPDALSIEQPEHYKKLVNINFSWKSTRVCGSAFMKMYRQLKEEQKATATTNHHDEDDSLSPGKNVLLRDESTRKWVASIQKKHLTKPLSETRKHYMEELFGEGWETISL